MPKLERPLARLNAKPATIVADMTQAIVKKNRASPRSVSVEYGIVAMAQPPCRPVAADTNRRPPGQRLARGRGLAVEAHVDGHLAEPCDRERDRKVLADRVLRRRAGEPHQHRVRRLLLRLLLGEAGVLAGEAVLRVAADPDALAQVLRAALVEV